MHSMEMGSESVRRVSAVKGVMDSNPNWKRTSTITFRIDMKVCLWTELKKAKILSHLTVGILFLADLVVRDVWECDDVEYFSCLHQMLGTVQFPL